MHSLGCPYVFATIQKTKSGGTMKNAFACLFAKDTETKSPVGEFWLTDRERSHQTLWQEAIPKLRSRR